MSRFMLLFLLLLQHRHSLADDKPKVTLTIQAPPPSMEDVRFCSTAEPHRIKEIVHLDKVSNEIDFVEEDTPLIVFMLFKVATLHIVMIYHGAYMDPKKRNAWHYGDNIFMLVDWKNCLKHSEKFGSKPEIDLRQPSNMWPAFSVLWELSIPTEILQILISVVGGGDMTENGEISTRGSTNLSQQKRLPDPRVYLNGRAANAWDQNVHVRRTESSTQEQLSKLPTEAQQEEQFRQMRQMLEQLKRMQQGQQQRLRQLLQQQIQRKQQEIQETQLELQRVKERAQVQMEPVLALELEQHNIGSEMQELTQNLQELRRMQEGEQRLLQQQEIQRKQQKAQVELERVKARFVVGLKLALGEVVRQHETERRLHALQVEVNQLRQDLQRAS